MLTLNTDLPLNGVQLALCVDIAVRSACTETDVTSITTDASAGTNDIGSSITVTTAGAHGFEICDAITIKGFDLLLQVIVEVKVHLLLIMYQTVLVSNIMQKLRLVQAVVQELIHLPQLRKAGFYTGASIGTPVLVYRPKSQRNCASALTVPIGEDVVPYTVTVGAARNWCLYRKSVFPQVFLVTGLCWRWRCCCNTCGNRRL